MVLPSSDELYERCRTYRAKIDAPWFTDPWDLNVLVARSGMVGEWDDFVLIATRDDAERAFVQVVRATADAWRGEWLDPSHPDGCVYVLDGHYRQALERGEHHGRPAMRQRRPFRYVRWPRDRQTVPTVAELEALAANGEMFEANCGTHHHNRAGVRAPPRPATDDSEGCTVSLYQHEHAAYMALVEQQLQYHGTTVVSPTYLKLGALLA